MFCLLSRCTVVLVTWCVFPTLPGTMAFAQEEDKFDVPWGNLYQHLLGIANTGLQAHNIRQDLHDNYDWEDRVVDGSELLAERLEALEEILLTNLQSTRIIWQVLVDNFDAFILKDNKTQHLEDFCCHATEAREQGCITKVLQNQTSLASYTPQQVLKQLEINHGKYKLSLVQYFGLVDGSMVMYPTRDSFQACSTYDPRRRYWYTESESPYPRDVVLLIDQTSSATHPQLLLATINRIIDSMTSHDRIIVVPSGSIANSGKIQGNWWRGQSFAGLGVWMAGDQFLKDRLRELVKTEVGTLKDSFGSHVDALHWAEYLLSFKPIYPLHVDRDAMDIVVLVTGRPGWDRWKGNIELEDNVNMLMNENISLIVFPLKGATEMSSWDIVPRPTTESSLHIAPMNTVEHLDRANLARYFTVQHPNEHRDANAPSNSVFTVPYFDAFSAGLIISICLPIVINDTFWGSVCNDASVYNIFKSITTIPDIEDAYVFAIDHIGRGILHPLIPSPVKLTDPPIFVQMTEVEQGREVNTILQQMVDGRPGSKIITGHLVRNVGRPFQINLPNAVRSIKTKLKYIWGTVKETRISLAVVLPLKNYQATAVTYRCRTRELCKAPHFQYHRWDLDAVKPETCRFFGMEAVKKNALVKLAPTCFRDILSYLKDENNSTVARLYGIFRHNEAIAGFLVDDNIREDVALGERAEDYWRNAGNMSQFIGARYLGSSNGVFVVYPGTRLNNQTYDPRLRPWYLRAANSVDQDPVVTLSPPYCDSFGAGLIVTVSMAITSPTDDRQVIAVVSGDLPSQYMNDNFVQQLPHKCNGEYFCLLVDESGYVVVHTRWQHVPPVHPTQCKVPAHGAHINEVEPIIGKTLVDMNILQRIGCLDYATADLFQYWKIQLPRHQTKIVTKQFSLSHVPFTNLYLIAYKTFAEQSEGCLCPKSWVPDQPPRCHNTCVDFCECPCIANLNTQQCPRRDKDLLKEKLPACWPRTPIIEHHPTTYDNHLHQLPACSTYNCTAPDRRSCWRMSISCFWYEEACHDINYIKLLNFP